MIFALLVAGAYALATLRRYSVAQTATLTTFALFLSSGLTTVSGAPAFNVQVDMRTDPWVQPCGPSVPAYLRQVPEVYRVEDVLKTVRTQVRVARNHYRKELKDVRRMYSEVTKELKQQYRLPPWLPEKQFEWYEREVWCLNKTRKAEIILPMLHDTLQRFAITFQQLLSVDVLEPHSNTAFIRNRNRIVLGMTREILKMLCEVESAMVNLDVDLPPRQKATIVVDSPNWTMRADYTQTLVQDSAFLRLYRIFLNDWTRILRNATAKGPGTCDPTKIRPHLPKPKKEKNKKQTLRLVGGRRRHGARKDGLGKLRLQGAAKRFPKVGKGQPKRGPRRKLTGNKQRETV